jgi:hypothetical protein
MESKGMDAQEEQVSAGRSALWVVTGQLLLYSTTLDSGTSAAVFGGLCRRF